MKEILSHVIPEKSPSPSLYFAKEITFMRAFIYAFCCDKNNHDLRAEQFLAACSRFGLDNPIPTITKRLNIFGNVEEIDKDFRRILFKFKNAHPTNNYIQNMDPDMHTTTDFKNTNIAITATFNDLLKKKNQTYDFQETEVLQPSKKPSAF